MTVVRKRIMIIVKRWYRSRKFQMITFIITILCVLYYISLNNTLHREPDLDITRSIVTLHTGDWSIPATTKPITHKPIAPTGIILSPDNTVSNRKSVLEYIESKLQEALEEDKGTGCEIPKLDPFAKEVTQFDKEMPKVVCDGRDWVKCYLSECRITKDVQSTMRDIQCEYRDILYESDNKYSVGPPTTVMGHDTYVLTNSDHVKIRCTAKHNNSILPSKWQGYAVGFRATVKPKKSPAGREDSLNVLILGFDSTSRNGFIRRMPHSYKVLTEELQATVLNGYNIVGDGTPAALFPILTGKTELELPDVRRKKDNNGTLDSMPFIFYKLKEDGYRTAYFEDMPWIGTFQYRFNGFRHQPADHYLRDFYLEESNNGRKWSKGFKSKYCVGDTPQYTLMLNITEQFLKLDGKRFIFTFIADITHDDFNMISTSDDDTANFLRQFRKHKMEEDTLLIVMGDHGPRYAKVRDTLQGKLEERLPLMAILLPERLKQSRPDAQTSLQMNADALTTPHDVHAMILDVIGFRQHWNSYKVQGADLTRGMTLLEPITRNRSCSEAGIEPHWCACLRWANVTRRDAMYDNTANALVAFINSLTEPVRDKCVPRTLTDIEWVMKQQANNRLLSFSAAKDADGYVGSFNANTSADKFTYQLKVVVGPGRGVYEASVTYFTKKNKFHIDVRDISRTNAYGNEPECISRTHPHLNMFCFCRDATPNET